MASVTQSIIQKYQSTTYALTPEVQRAKQARLDKLAQHFMSLVVLLCSSDEKAQKISDKSIKVCADLLLVDQGKRKKVESDRLKRMIGQFITDEFTTNAAFRGLLDQFELIYEEEDSGGQENAWDLSSIGDLDLERELWATIQQNQIETSSGGSTQHSANISKQPQTWGQDPHQMRVISYLMEISAPQTELSYLCQQMGWNLVFTDRLTSDNLFQVTVAVDFDFKKTRRTLSENFAAKKKKLGRLVASFKMLRMIYLSYPPVWDTYQIKRSKKSLPTDKNPFNPLKFLHHQILSERIVPISLIKDKDEQYEREKAAYLENITYFRSELNFLNQQNPGIFVSKMDRMPIGNLWKVKGYLTIKFKGKQEEFDWVAQDKNSKTAQESIAKLFVNKIFDSCRQIMEKMIQIKSKKNIKT